MVSTQVLKGFELFESLDNSQLVKIASLCHENTLDGGALCFIQGRKATELHLCLKGKVYVLLQAYDMEITVHTVEAGEVFGWSALVKPYIYTSSAACAGKVDEICIKGSDLLELFERDPFIGYIVMKNLSTLVSSRLAGTTEKLCREIAIASGPNRGREL